jgi:Flp pilus assembly protein TadB
MFEALLATLTMSVAAVALGWSCRDYYLDMIGVVERDLSEKLRRLRRPTVNLRRYLIAWSVVVALVLFGFWLFLDSPTFGLLAAVFLAAAPWYLVRRMAERNRLRIEDQFADAMVAFSSAVRAGLSLAQCMELLADQTPRPIQNEFRQIVAEYKLGKPLDRTLTEAKERLRSENFALFAAAVLASRESGGRLNETVDRIAHSVLELQRLERKIKAETAQARRSAIYMAIAPLIILIVYYFVDPLNTTRLFTTVPGQVLLSISLVLDVVAYVWARAILTPDI